MPSRLVFFGWKFLLAGYIEGEMDRNRRGCVSTGLGPVRGRGGSAGLNYRISTVEGGRACTSTRRGYSTVGAKSIFSRTVKVY
jgi:hypothetical protein